MSGDTFYDLILSFLTPVESCFMSETRTPQWHRISSLPMIATHIDEMLEEAVEQLTLLQEAIPKPYVLDDYTVNRVVKVFTTQQNDLWLFDEQLQRWGTTSLTSNQAQEVARLVTQMKRVRETVSNILVLANDLKEQTIEKQLAKSDLQVGLESLLKSPPKPKS